MTWQCFACLKLLPDTSVEWEVVTEGGETVTVGSDCGKRTREAGTDGYSPDRNDVTLFTRAAYFDNNV